MAILAQEEKEDEKIGGSGEAQTQPLSGLPSGGASPKGARPNYTKSNFTSGRLILDKNKGASQPNLAQGFVNKAQGQQQRISDEASKYQEGLQGTQNRFKLEGGELTKAVRGVGEDQTKNFNKVQALLGETPEISNFSTQSGVSIGDVNALNSQAGVQDLLSRKMQDRGGMYTRGQSALDAALFNRGPQRRMQVDQALAAKKATEDLQQAKTGEGDQKREATLKAIEDMKRGYRGSLSTMTQELNKKAEKNIANLIEQRRSKENVAREKKRLQAEAENLARNYAREQGGGNSRLESLILDNLRSQIRERGVLGGLNTVDLERAGRAYNKDEAQQFNRISELLGLNDKVEASNLSGSGGYGLTGNFKNYQKNALLAAKSQLERERLEDEARLNAAGTSAIRGLERQFVRDPATQVGKGMGTVKKKFGF